MEDPSWRRHAGSEHELQTYASKAIHEEVDYLKEHDLDDIASEFFFIIIIFTCLFLFLYTSFASFCYLFVTLSQPLCVTFS